MSAEAVSCDRATDFSSFDPSTIKRSGSFDLEMRPGDAFLLFTAHGEKHWAPGWEPFVLNGNGYEEGTVWITCADGRVTCWYVARYDVVNRHAQYVRVTPGVSAGSVEVQVASNGDGGSTVNVAYQLTGLSPDANADLKNAFEESEYAAMMEEWRHAINDNRDRINDYLHSHRQSGRQ